MALTFEQWLQRGGYTQDWYRTLDVMHQDQVEQLYRNSEDDQGAVQTLSSHARQSLARVAAGQPASEPDEKQAKAQSAASAKTVADAATAQQTVAQAMGAPGSTLAEILKAMPPDQAAILQQNSKILSDPAQAQSFVTAWQATQSSIYNLAPGWANQQVQLQREQNQTITNARSGPGPHNDGNVQQAQWTSAINAMFQPGLWNDTGRVSELQDQLTKAGYADPAALIHPGQYDEVTRRAYVNVIQDAIAEHKTIQEVLDDGAVNFAKQKAQQKSDFLSARSSSQNPFVAPPLTLDDPAKVQATVSAHFKDAVGRKPTANELKAATAVYRSFEAKQNDAATQAAHYQSEATNAGNLYQFDQAHLADERKLGITPTKVPAMPATPTIQTYDPEAEAANAARGQAPNEAGGQDLRSAFDGFVKAIQGP